VLKSLTPNHLNLLKHLALLLLDTSEPDGTVPFDTLLKVTKRKAIASNHVKLKSLLTELIDHRVVIQRRAPTTGAQTYHMPYGRKQIEVISQGDFDSVDKCVVAVGGRQLIPFTVATIFDMPARILRGFSTLLRVTPQMFLCSASI
ncbi:Origin recognition complex subunit 2, partial [Perkinsus olseni]